MTLIVARRMDVQGRISVGDEVVNLDVVIHVALLVTVNRDGLRQLATRGGEDCPNAALAAETPDGERS